MVGATMAATGKQVRIGILGAGGRMGQAIAAAAGDAGVMLAGGADRAGVTGEVAPGLAITADENALAGQSDVLIDFSVPAALEAHLAAAVAAGKPIVIGTTGLEPRHHALIDQAARTIAVLQTGNTSLGVTLLAALVRQAAARLARDWDIEIVEMHHRHKVDAPSGTSLLLGEAAAAGRGVALGEVADRGRDGITGARADGAIGFASLRGGSVAGDHMVVFAGEGERIELGHRAESRAIFARGAVKAAQWIAGRAAGRYAMGDVLDL
ncbi:4-hydroxy-tetrahydrodipicolinate reductase [uncultured Sphingomonas sp.]|uniref:4-hydroxy-tetrahydrodipicolinate reductase n=1 Tax=uncultured Sphingomonas sp. TaxID=158754 RepID=UPI0026023271|nr:4-hydroxy-tetrahydrodipicolinate reductase [uncultured Sphingomonas sp.]